MTRTSRVAIAVACALVLLHTVAFPFQKKKKDKDFTQTLAALPEPPAAVTVETARLSYRVTPLSAKGLLSQQTRDALKTLLALSRGTSVVKIRAYVAGTGDLRRIQSIVSEEFSERRIALPVLSVVQVGGLPLEGAQVQLEATLQERRVVNPRGVLFIAGQETAGAGLAKALDAAGGQAEDMLRVSCFADLLESAQALRTDIGRRFPKAQLSLVQAQRITGRPVTQCEGVARLRSAAAPSPDAVPVTAPRLVLAGAQLAFRYQEEDARLAFQRLEKTLQAAGSSLRRAVKLNVYPLSPQLADLVRKVQFDFLDRRHPPATTMLPFEGLPSMDASFGLEVVALADGAGSSSQ
ncbi:MAG: RidA family protein [Candidatus Solibacter usitatus]|nr:RidA family protein [Candidatus Solibacter usitatus]